MAHIIVLEERIFDELKDICLDVYGKQTMMTVDELMGLMMDHPEVPMHYPYHHFIMPAALLTLAAMEEKVQIEALEEMLMLAITRSKDILGGFCGNYGACGAGVGAGIFMSIYTDASPMAVKNWQWANEVTGIALQAISKVPGPRCCKRTAYLSLQAAVPYINEKLELHLSVNDHIQCKYYERNAQCKKSVCPYYVVKD